MNTLVKICLSVTAAVMVSWVAEAQINVPTMTTVVSVPDMHCPNCAKKLSTQLSKVQGVDQVAADVEKKTVAVTAKSGMTLSPRQVWEAVEKGGYRPARLTGPRGDFKTKPQS